MILLQFNLKTFFTLLQGLLAELERPIPTEASQASQQLTPVARHLLPQVRQYSSWLLVNAPKLVVQTDEVLMLHLREFWKVYTQTLTFFIFAFPLLETPEIPYLLEEDHDTVAFLPFSNPITNSRYRHGDGEPRRSFFNSGVNRCSLDDEMLYRVKDLVRDGVRLIKNQVSRTRGTHQCTVLTR